MFDKGVNNDYYVSVANDTKITTSSGGMGWPKGTFTGDPCGSPVSTKDDIEDILLNQATIFNKIEKIEERLAILVPNPEIEARYANLRKLHKQYKKLEKEILESEEIIRILKSD